MWPKYCSFNFSISPSNECSGLISFRMDWLALLAVQGFLRVFSNTTPQKHQFFGAQLSLWFNSHIHTWLLERINSFKFSDWRNELGCFRQRLNGCIQPLDEASDWERQREEESVTRWNQERFSKGTAAVQCPASEKARITGQLELERKVPIRFIWAVLCLVAQSCPILLRLHGL